MTKSAWIEPVAGRQVRDPQHGTLITCRTQIPLNAYWQRRINCADVVQVYPDFESKPNNAIELKGKTK